MAFRDIVSSTFLALHAAVILYGCKWSSEVLGRLLCACLQGIQQPGSDLYLVQLCASDDTYSTADTSDQLVASKHAPHGGGPWHELV